MIISARFWGRISEKPRRVALIKPLPVAMIVAFQADGSPKATSDVNTRRKHS